MCVQQPVCKSVCVRGEKKVAVLEARRDARRVAATRLMHFVDSCCLMLLLVAA